MANRVRNKMQGSRANLSPRDNDSDSDNGEKHKSEVENKINS
jgi:hypothetical protein